MPTVNGTATNDDTKTLWDKIIGSFFIYLTYFWLLSIVISNLMLACKIGIAINFITRVKKISRQLKRFCVRLFKKIRNFRKEENPEIVISKLKDAETQTEDFGGVSIRITMQDIFDLATNNGSNRNVKNRDDDKDDKPRFF